MNYEKTPISTKLSTVAIKKEVSTRLSDIKTASIIWYLVKRHKFALIAAYATVLSVFYFLPFMPQLLLHLL